MLLTATALGDGPRALVAAVARRARERGALVTFDPNFRPSLWGTAAEAAAAQAEVLPYVDWYLGGVDEERTLVAAEDVAAAAQAAGARDADVRPGERGGPIVDEVGAGDAVAAGFALGLLEGRGRDDCVRRGNVVAAGALRGTGDWETLPSREELAL